MKKICKMLTSLLCVVFIFSMFLVSCDRENTGENNNGQNNTEQNNTEQSNNNKEDINIDNSSEGKQEENKDQSLESGYIANGNITSAFQIACRIEKNQYSIDEERIPVYISFGISSSNFHPEYYDVNKRDFHINGDGVFVEEPRIEVEVIYNWNKDMEVLHSFTVDEFYEEEYFYNYVSYEEEHINDAFDRSKRVFQKEEICYIDTARLISAYENGKYYITFNIENLDEEGNPMGHGRDWVNLFYEIEDGYITFSTIAPPKYYK